MRGLTVLYDGDCGFCQRCRRWVESEPKFLPMRFVAQGSEEARRRWPALAVDGAPQELLVIDTAGGVYRAENAWIMVLYALRKYRRISMKLARPGMRPIARRVVHFVARNRQRISCLVGDQTLIDIASSQPAPPRCTTNTCDIAGTRNEPHDGVPGTLDHLVTVKRELRRKEASL